MSVEALKAWRESGEKAERRDPIEKARMKPTSLRLAINGKCWDCVGAGVDPGARAAIRNCTSTNCTLHPVRPYQASDDEASE